MTIKLPRRRLYVFGVVLAVLALVASACGNDDGDDSATLDDADNRIIQVSDPRDAEDEKGEELVVGDGSESVDPSWDTEFSREFGITLAATFDSSGEPAWDPSDHPVVYVASEGPGYSGLVSSDVTTPGFLMVDAATRETVAAVHFEIDQEEVFEPHGLGVSPGGEWIYVPTGTAAAWGSPLGGGRLLIIDAKTFKINKILATQGNPHHVKSFVDPEGRELTLVENFNDSTFYVLDPNDDNKVVGGITADGLNGRGYLSFAHPSGKYAMVTVRTPFDTDGGVAVVDVATWRTVKFINTHDSDPIYVAYSADGNLAYVSGSHGSTVVKIDTSDPNPAAWEVVGMTSAGTVGPYGLTLSWDETKLWAIGKGESAHNLGNTAGLIDPAVMSLPARAWAPGSQGSFFTDCVRGDHGLVNPDPAANEMWISCNASFETVIWDLESGELKESVPTPNGGSTHNGAFVRYSPDFEGQVLSDQNGLHGEPLAERAQMAASAQEG